MVSEPVKPAEFSKPAEREGKLDLNEAVEEFEEEIEYEEVEEFEEEIEYVEVEEEEEEEEEEEIEEEVIEEEVAEEEETCDNVNCVGDTMKVDEKDEDESAKHAELLALPPHGSEVYLGGIPTDVSEEDLRCFCESVGEVFEVRFIKDKHTSENKDYAFVTYSTKELATKAIEDLNNTEFKGKKIKCSTSQAKHRLFIANIPKDWKEEEMKKAVSKAGPGVISVQLMTCPQKPRRKRPSRNRNRNRGYAFIEYYNGACAEYSRMKMSSENFKLDDNTPTVSWADPMPSDSASNSQIKSVYVKHLPQNVTQDQLKKLFVRHGKITSVVLPPAKPEQENRIGFVHFAEGSSAMKAVRKTNKYEIDGQLLGCSLAKRPASDKPSDTGSTALERLLLPNYALGYGCSPAKPPASDKPSDTGSTALEGPFLPNYVSGYGLVRGAYNTMPASFAQPMAYARAPNPGVAMVPPVAYARAPNPGAAMVPPVAPARAPNPGVAVVPPVAYSRAPNPGVAMVPPVAPARAPNPGVAMVPPVAYSRAPNPGVAMVPPVASAWASNPGVAMVPPVAYARAPNPGVAMVPMMLPDGRLGSVMQQPGPSVAAVAAASQRGWGHNENSSGGRQNNDGNRGQRYHPY